MNAYDVFKVITTFIDQVLKENPDQVDKYKKRQKAAVGIFCRPGHEKPRGKANPKMVNAILK